MATINTVGKRLSKHSDHDYLTDFGFLYFTRLAKITEALVLLRIVNEELTIRKLKLISKMLGAWLTCAGITLFVSHYLIFNVLATDV